VFVVGPAGWPVLRYIDGGAISGRGWFNYMYIPNLLRYGGVGCNTMESRTGLPTFGRNLLPYETLATAHSSHQECEFLALTCKCRRAEMWRGRYGS
jgi:hypothetical protein